MNKSFWYVLAGVTSILLGVLFYLIFTYSQLKNQPEITTITNEVVNKNEVPITIKGTYFCLDAECTPGLRANDGKVYFLWLKNVKDPEYFEDSSKIEITGTLNKVETRMIDGKEYEVITINTYERI